MIIPPKYSVSDVIGQIKAQSASRLRKKFSYLSKVYWKENIVWSPGYFVSTVGIDEKSIIEYVKFQQSQDLGQAKLELFYGYLVRPAWLIACSESLQWGLSVATINLR